VKTLMIRLLTLLLCMLLCASSAIAEDAVTYDFSANFPDKFLAEGEPIIHTENTYKSQNISVEITLVRAYDSDIYVADIYVRSLDNFQRAFPYNRWGASEGKMTDLAAKNNAIIAITGDSSDRIEKGIVFANGKLIRKSHNRLRDLAIIYKNGEMVAPHSSTINDREVLGQRDDIWHCFLFGPSLLDAEGKAYTSFISNYERISTRNPRSVLGYYEPGHYCFVQVDGRKTTSKVDPALQSRGITLVDLAAFMESIGCKAAYNLDGGQSSILWFSYEPGVYSTPYNGGRPLTDILVIKEVE